MKAYPMTESDLDDLAGLGFGATVAFALASFMFGLAVDLQKDLSLATDTPAEAQAFWSAVRIMAMVVAVVSALVGGGLIVRGHTKLNRIKRDTTFES